VTAAAPPRVIVTRPFPGTALARLGQRCDLWVGPEGGTPRAVLFERAKGAQGLICTLDDRIDAELMAKLPELRIVATPAAGTNHIDLAAAQARGVWVCNAPDITTEATADLAFGLLLATARRLVEGDRLVRGGRFAGWSPGLLLGADLAGATLGVVGAGRIGRAVLKRALGFGLHLVYYRPGGPVPALEAALAAEFRPLDALLAESDFVSIHVPLTPETHHLIDAAALQRMKPGAILINTARGPVVDEAALAKALASGQLGGAGLDVYEDEPRVASELMVSERTVLAPHLGSATRSTRSRMMEIAVEAVEAVLLDRRTPAHALAIGRF
jgi:glyoxylate reductase